MQRLTFINSRGQEVIFTNTDPYIFWRISGIELPAVQANFTQATGQHGYSLTGLLLESRIVTLTGHVHGKNHKNGTNETALMYAQRRRLNAVCSPALGPGTLIYENSHGKWTAQAFCKDETYTNKLKNIQTLSISFECPLPFWLDSEQSQVMLAYVGGGLQFPLVTPAEFGMLGYRALADNSSDGPVPIEMYVTGGSENPKITNVTTGEFIHIERRVEEWEQIYINTDPEHMEVTLMSKHPVTGEDTRELAYGYLSNTSNLFSLVPGVNELTFDSDDENKTIRIRIYYHKRFAGV